MKKKAFFSTSYTFSSIYSTENGIYPEPNLTVLVQAKYAYSPQSVSYWCQISSMTSPTRQTPQKGPPKYHSAIYWSTWTAYEHELSRHRCCLAFRFGDKIIRVRGCRMTNIKEYLHGMRTCLWVNYCSYKKNGVIFFFSSSHLLSWPFCILPPSRNSDPGSHSRLFFPPTSTHYGSCLAFLSRGDFSSHFLPSSTRIELCLPRLYRLSQQLILFFYFCK